MNIEKNSAVVRVVEAARRKLVDTGTRNRFVHINRDNSRGNFLNIINERSDDVYGILRKKAHRMRFQAMGKDRVKSDDRDYVSIAEVQTFEDSTTDRWTDDLLETALGPEGLARRLLRLATDAKSAEEEQGLNILYLAIGFMRWKESGSSDVKRESPLILLPVDLVRNARSSTFDIVVRDDDIAANLPLGERLRGDFGILLPEIEESEDWSPEGYFDVVAAAIANKPEWSIDRDGMQLGFFSFAKLLMHHDLELSKWPDGEFEENGLLRGLLLDGFEAQEPIFRDNDRLDKILDPADIIQVVDADGSQTKVIEEVRRGANLVVQGPSGTGKSQTITNLLAAAAHDGKTVLFVAEKMAALSVVHQRLQKNGLSDVCLELHSRSANKKAVAQELGRTLASSGRMSPEVPEPEALRKTRDELNEIAELLHLPLKSTGESPIATMSELIGFLGSGAPPPSIKGDGLGALNAKQRVAATQAIDNFVTAYSRTGDPRQHPFYGVQALDLQPMDLARLAAQLREAIATFDALEVDASKIAGKMAIKSPDSLGAVASFCEMLTHLDAVPTDVVSHMGIFFDAADTRLVEALAAGYAWRSAMDEASGTFGPAAWTTDLAGLRPALVRGRNSFLSRIFGGYRQASAALESVLSSPLPKEPSKRLALVDRILDIKQKRVSLADDENFLQAVLKEHWRGERTPFGDLCASCRWIAVMKGSGQFPKRERLSGAIGAIVDPKTVASGLNELRQRFTQQFKSVLQVLNFNSGTADLDAELQKIPLSDLRSRLHELVSNIDGYADWVGLMRSVDVAAKLNAGVVVDSVIIGAIPPERATSEFLFACAERRWAATLREAPELQKLSDIDRHAIVSKFHLTERDRLKDVRDLIRTRHADQMPKGSAGEIGIIRGEIGRKRGHKSIRWLMQNAGSMVQRIKPIMLMSPISVAQFLPPGTVTFDLLVIDEASQIKPEDALGCIARARQVVVVGDQKQLPPTSFFDRLVEDTDDIDEDDSEMPIGASVADMESILSLCEARGINSRMLTWHYRSRDPSLIRISNAEFYEGQLVLPPSPLQLDQNYGLKLTKVPGVYASRSSGLGRAGTNRLEAERVVEAIANHARSCPELSLGVVAFSKAQSDMLTEVLESRRRNDPVMDSFLRTGKSEDIFVKNIENVQGDERDVILISVGYGPQEPGARLTTMSFGPINGEGGGRRLNVLFSRARVRCEVFCSFDPADIDPTRASRDGLRILKRFLDFAKTGIIDDRAATGMGPDSPFEEDVARVIRSFGFDADYQVGSAGFRVDLGIRHPDWPAQYLLAVECDGAAYHSALWARERDRLRQEILENLGWQFHRIWSTDWFHRREREIQRLKNALEMAKNGAAAGIKIKGPNEHPGEQAPETEQTPVVDDGPETLDHLKILVPAYQRSDVTARSNVEPHDAPVSELARLVTQIVLIEGPIHIEELSRRISAAFGKTRTGSRIATVTESAAKLAVSSSGGLVREGPFLMTIDQKVTPPVRDRSNETGSLLKAEFLPPLEVAAAAGLILQESGYMETPELTKAVAQLLGFLRLGPDLAEVIGSIVRDVHERTVAPA